MKKLLKPQYYKELQLEKGMAPEDITDKYILDQCHALHKSSVLVYSGHIWNSHGWEVCGVPNTHGKPCLRLGSNCPFHEHDDSRPEINNVCNNDNDIYKGQKQLSGYRKSWGYDEHLRFLRAFKEYDNNWIKVAEIVGTRSSQACQSHGQKYLNRLHMKKSGKMRRTLLDLSIVELEKLVNDEAKNEKVVAKKPMKKDFYEASTEETSEISPEKSGDVTTEEDSLFVDAPEIDF